MNLLDWLVIGVYILALIGFSVHLSRGQENTDDYFLGSRAVPWWGIGLSTMATQLGAVSFISAPAFVALRDGGGMIWLGYEFAVPIAIIVTMTIIIPFLHRKRIVSIYEYLERRFDSGTRTLISIVFQISRALATGVGVYAVAIVLSVTIGLELWLTIVITAVVAMIYDTLGGIRAVIFTDVVQMVILTAGILICSLFALHHVGGWSAAMELIPSERWTTVNFRAHGLGDGEDFGFWPLVLGGLFLYMAYYGCDQSQVQRELSARNEDDLRKSLFFNGVCRFPVVLGYCLMGLFIGALLWQDASFASAVPEDSPDYMVPVFIVEYLPNGLIGLLVVAIFAAAMSSLDSALNSLSAATYKDLYERYLRPDAGPREALRMSRIFTVFWGLFCTAFAFAVGGMAGTVIEAINKIGSAFYGPILGTFLLGILTRRAVAPAVKWGIVLGVATNLVLWVGFPGVSWLWWNLTGFAVTFGVGYLASFPASTGLGEDALGSEADTVHGGLPPTHSRLNWKPAYAFLVFYFFFIILLSLWIQP